MNRFNYFYGSYSYISGGINMAKFTSRFPTHPIKKKGKGFQFACIFFCIFGISSSFVISFFFVETEVMQWS